MLYVYCVDVYAAFQANKVLYNITSGLRNLTKCRIPGANFSWRKKCNTCRTYYMIPFEANTATEIANAFE